jgi:hypothetical protein
MGKNFIPSKDVDFDTWFNNLVEYVFARVMVAQPAWTHIPKADAEALAASFTAWHTAYTVTLKPHTPVETAEKNRVRAVSEKDARLFVNRFLRYPPVTDEDRDNMSIPNHDNKATPIPAPKAQAEADLVFPGIHLVELVNIRKVAGVILDDPRSYHGVSIHIGILDATHSEWRITEVPTSGKNLPYEIFTRRKRSLLDFDGESGKTIYICLRYENEKGGEDGVGPFGPIFKAVIP